MFWKDFLEFLSWIKTHPIQTPHLILLTLTFVLSSNQYVQHSQYSDLDIHWKIRGSHLGRSKRTIPSPKYPDQLQCPHSLQLTENQSFFYQQSEQCTHSGHLHLSIPKFKNQWIYTSTQPVSLHGTYWNNFIFPLPTTYVHISQQVTSFLVL